MVIEGTSKVTCSRLVDWAELLEARHRARRLIWWQHEASCSLHWCCRQARAASCRQQPPHKTAAGQIGGRQAANSPKQLLHWAQQSNEHNHEADSNTTLSD